MTEQRMRIYRGRVMHRVKQRGDWYVSLCMRPHPVLGAKRPLPRVENYTGDWTTDNPLGYPDCKHCPADAPTEETDD